MSKAITTAVAASALFALLQILLQIIVSFFVFSSTPVVIRYAGAQAGSELFFATVENNSLRKSNEIRFSSMHPSRPTIVTAAGGAPVLRSGGRSEETEISFGSLRPGQRRSVLLGFPTGTAAPEFQAGTLGESLFFGDRESFVWFSILNLALSIGTMTLVYLVLTFLSNQTFYRDLDQLKRDRADVAKQAEKASKDIENLRTTIHRVKVIYQRKMDGLIRENAFWRNAMADLVARMDVSKERAKAAVQSILARAGIHATTAAMSDEEFLTFLEDETTNLTLTRI